MKLKNGFILHEMGDEYVVVAIDECTKIFNGIINLNRTGAFLWKQMEGNFSREVLVEALLKKYEVTEDAAINAVNIFIDKLISAKIIEE